MTYARFLRRRPTHDELKASGILQVTSGLLNPHCCGPMCPTRACYSLLQLSPRCRQILFLRSPRAFEIMKYYILNAFRFFISNINCGNILPRGGRGNTGALQFYQFFSQRIYISDTSRTHSIPLRLPNMCLTQPLPALYIEYTTLTT